MLLGRRLGAAVLAVVAVVVWFGMKPEEPTTTDFDSRIVAAMANYEANASSTDNVYQQQVTNGWVAKDLLEIIADENNETGVAAPDERPGVLVLLGVLGIALGLATTERIAAEGPTSASSPPSVPETGGQSGAPPTGDAVLESQGSPVWQMAEPGSATGSKHVMEQAHE